ncbi:ATP-binding cassette domain-containing protein [Gordonia sp. NPDC003376]
MDIAPAIRAQSLLKTFRGTDGTVVRAVDHLDLTIAPGEVVAVLGPNGAGKTTTLDMMLGLSRPDSGEMTVFGMSPRQAARAGAESALRAAGIEASLPDPHRDTDHGTLFAWVLREAVTNVVRHSGATRCEVILGEDSITVHDNGTGMDPAFLGNGLRGLAERVEAGGGTLHIDSDPHGTTLVARIGRTAQTRSDDTR